LLVVLLLVSLVSVVYTAGTLFFEYKKKTGDLNTAMVKLQHRMQAARREERKLSVALKSMKEKYERKVKLINSIIMQKSFSWIDFFAHLESSLPDSSYIVSLAPKLVRGSTVEVKLRVASRNLDELLALINRLRNLKLSEIRVENETKDESGFLLSEISMSYERNI